MLDKLNNLIIDSSQTWWKFLLVGVIFGGSLASLMAITRIFPELANGAIPFDMQNELRPAEIFEQLAGYSPEAFDLYYRFQIIDFIFPLFGSIFAASICAFGLRNIAPAFYARLASRNLFLLFLIPALFDYMENINLLWAVIGWPEQIDAAATFGVAAKMAKLAALSVTNALMGVLLLGGLLAWIARRAGFLGSAGQDETS